MDEALTVAVPAVTLLSSVVIAAVWTDRRLGRQLYHDRELQERLEVRGVLDGAASALAIALHQMSLLASAYGSTGTWSDGSFTEFERLIYAAITQRERLAIRLTTEHILYSLYSSALGSLDALVDFFGEEGEGASAESSDTRLQAITSRAIEAQREFLNGAAAIAGTVVPGH